MKIKLKNFRRFIFVLLFAVSTLPPVFFSPSVLAQQQPNRIELVYSCGKGNETIKEFSATGKGYDEAFATDLALMKGKCPAGKFYSGWIYIVLTEKNIQDLLKFCPGVEIKPGERSLFTECILRWLTEK